MKRFHFKNKDSIVGVFKKGKPFKGHFYSKESTIEKIEHYKKGVKTGYQYYYSTVGSLLKTPLDSINYIKGKPFDGIEIDVIDKDYHKHFYKKGKEVQTDIYDLYYQGITDLPLYRVTPTNTGFTTKKSNENTFEKYNELTYTNTEKTEGKVEFFSTNEKGYIQFKNNKLTDVQIKSKNSYANFTIYLEKPNILLADAKSGDLQIKMYPEFKLAASPNYKDFLSIEDLFFKGDGVTYFYLDDKLLSKCTLKKDKPYQGIIIWHHYEDKMFKYAKYIEGELIEKKDGITKGELLKLLQTQ
jgi:hypothetical protein